CKDRRRRGTSSDPRSAPAPNRCLTSATALAAWLELHLLRVQQRDSLPVSPLQAARPPAVAHLPALAHQADSSRRPAPAASPLDWAPALPEASAAAWPAAPADR